MLAAEFDLAAVKGGVIMLRRRLNCIVFRRITLYDNAAAPAAAEGESLLSPSSAALAGAAFAALNQPTGGGALSFGDGRTVEGLVAELLRPMLKEWLDANLPPIVEKLVQAEIDRINKR